MKKILVGVLFALSMTSCAGADEDLSINVDPKQSNFTVSLAANPTTGYQWKVVQMDQDLLSLSSSQYQRPQSKLIGAGGTMVFTFALNKGKNIPEQTKITFKYARPWESNNSGTLQNVTVHFVKSK
jgi:inhibitor of cysteine peptidase